MEYILKQKIELIAECIFNKIQEQQIVHLGGLYGGEFSILLFLNYYSKYSQDPKAVFLTDTYAKNLVEKLETDISLHTFCDGLSGILYLFEFLRENEFIDIDIQNVEIILEDYLIREMKRDIQNQNYDFLHGALGVGVYFLKKKTNRQVIEELIDFLYNTAEKDVTNKVFKWKSVLNEKGDQMGYNISLSHGISSIVLFLSHAIESNIENDKLFELLQGAVNYLFSQEIDVQVHGSYFPSQSIENNTQTALRSRLAWCYGDLGVAFAIWYAGNVINRVEWKKKGLGILCHSTSRTSLFENNVFDAGVCHGAAGIAMIYRRMYIETKYDIFMSATNYWLNQALNFSKFDDGLAGYKSYIIGNWECDYSLLMGVSGIGLTFISYLMNDQQVWDEMFLLS
jgi:hypothetical protein